ncbi:acyltransferase family protein [Flavobacterium psychrotrophum]|uniref:acyltransferase family protein n=1 Tax=Flavobacterium psychrotrophum TaxID=2294119 RepID=UPI000E315CE9|nr:acyltransferase [Flavobacterium psychrotrophum]
MTNSIQQKFYGLDHLRALAITYVFLFHYFILSGDEPAWLPCFAKFGWSGVDLFFVLSGFLISLQLFGQIKFGQRISLRQFFIKRIFRIFPAYFLTVALYFCIPIFREKEALPPLWKFITFTQNFGLNLKDSGTFSHAWSLCVEEHFYLLLPLMLLGLVLTGCFKKSYWLLILLFILGFVLRWYSYNYLFLPKAGYEYNWMYWYKYIYYPTYNRLDGLLTGVTIAALYRFMPDLWQKLSQYGNLLLIISLMILVGGYYLCYDPHGYYASIFGFPVVSIGYGFMVFGALSSDSFLYKWKSGITTFIATLSYAIYLTHKGVIHLTHLLLKDCMLNSNLVLFISILACIAVAYLINVVVEKPFIKLGRKISHMILMMPEIFFLILLHK